MNYYSYYKNEVLKPYTRNESKVYDYLQSTGIHKPYQINLVNICSDLGIEVIYDNSFSSLYSHPILKVITVDSRLHEQDQRVVLAHELGHAILHRGNQLTHPEGLIRKQENQANNFADYLLMPFFMFHDLPIEDCSSEKQIIHALAFEFNVPHSLAKRRFNNLKSRLCELVFGYGVM